MNAFNRAFYFIFLVSLLAFSASIGLELFAKMEPCFFCKAQRICYFFLALFAAIGILIKEKQAMAILLIVLSFSNLSIASYHSGVQAGVISDVCVVTSPSTLQDFKNMLFQKQHVQSLCSSITWLFGVPVTIWSVFFSFACLATITITTLVSRSQAFFRNHSYDFTLRQ